MSFPDESLISSKVTPAYGHCLNIDHITFWVGNAKQAAGYYISHFGFEPFAYKGLECASRNIAAHVVKSDRIYLQFISSLVTDATGEFIDHLNLHGDSVKDIAFTVDDLDTVLSRAVENGAKVVREKWTESDPVHGRVTMATIFTEGSVTHSFVERSSFTGTFLPGYTESPLGFAPSLPVTNLSFIDHVVATRLPETLMSTRQWYEKSLQFHRFWSVDDSIHVETSLTALKFLVVANSSETIKMTILEPVVNGKKKSQVTEFNEYNNGPGIQHIALHTENIIETVTAMRNRGMVFLSVPGAYYDLLEERLKTAKIVVKEDLKDLRKLQILLDYDEKGYLLQIFTKPVQDRPTLFFEIIQRNNHKGFGAGNFKALFAAVEREQLARGNLTK